MKRVLDIVLALSALIVLFPVIALVALLVRVRLGAPVLFRQVRPGKDARPFQMIKFRTMTDARDAHGDLLPDHERLPAFGRFLRSTSLDELPELLNVLTGDMSFVGPRPLLMEYLPLYDEVQARRHEVRPGITGLAQVMGRNALNWESKFAYDVEYIERQSLALDLKILILTVWSVVARKGISADGEATMPRFTGSKGEHS